MKQRMVQLDRLAGAMNDWLTLFAIGLTTLYLVATIVLKAPNLAATAATAVSASEGGLILSHDGSVAPGWGT
jgi:hypothetical protein